MHKKEKFKLSNHDCLPNLALMYIMLAYSMLLAALSNAVCLYNAVYNAYLLNVVCCFI